MNKFKRIKVYPLVSVQDVAKVHYGKSLKAEERVLSGLIPVFGSSGKIGTHDKTLVEYPTIIIGRKGSVGKVTYRVFLSLNILGTPSLVINYNIVLGLMESKSKV